jgi:hypothetical protein
MIIVNFSTDVYKKGQQRLQASLNGYKTLMLNDYVSIGSPTHQDSPYEFKIWSIEKASCFDHIVLWMDSSMWLVGDMSKIENLILKDGYFMSEAGAWVGDWTNQFTRDYFKLTHEEAKVPGGFCMFSAGLLGLDMTHPLAKEFFAQWKASALAGCFKGDWSDHRHDMSAASIISQRLGMKYQRGGEHMSYIGPGYSEPEKGSVIYLQGIH